MDVFNNGVLLYFYKNKIKKKKTWKIEFVFKFTLSTLFSIEFDSRVPKFMVNEEDYPCGFSDIDFMCDEDNYCEFSDGRNFTE